MAGRRTILALPALLLAPAARADTAVPPFPQWIGRTALLRSPDGAARLLLARDGTGVMTLRVMFACRNLPIARWDIAEDGSSVTYARPAVLDPSRMVEGEARILPGEDRILWTESRARTAEFEGFAAPDAVRSCS